MQSRPVLTLSVKAAAAIARGRGVTAAGALPAAGAAILGVVERDVAIGETAAAVALGTAVAEAGAAIALGSSVQMDALGRVVVATTGVVAGQALQAAAAAGDLIEILIR